MEMKFLETAEGRKLQRRYIALKEELSTLSWLTNGSVTPNHPGNWRWTRKINAKTVSVALSEAQAELFKDAITNHRKLESILLEMRAISQQVLLQSAPGNTRKPATKKRPKPALT